MATKAADPKHSPADETAAAPADLPVGSIELGPPVDIAALRAELAAELLPAVKAELMAQLRADLAKELRPDKPPMGMRARPHDRFITEANGSGPLLRHYRCDNAVSVKVAELDMDKWEAYRSGELPIPEGKTAESAAAIRGAWIAFVDTHCYCYTDNQVRNIERLKSLPPEKGGMSGIYEDTGERPFSCPLCLGLPPFGNRQTYEAHVVATHGPDALSSLAGYVPAPVAGTGGPIIVRQ